MSGENVVEPQISSESTRLSCVLKVFVYNLTVSL